MEFHWKILIIYLQYISCVLNPGNSYFQLVYLQQIQIYLYRFEFVHVNVLEYYKACSGDLLYDIHTCTVLYMYVHVFTVAHTCTCICTCISIASVWAGHS